MPMDVKIRENRSNNTNEVLKIELQKLIQPEQLVGDIFSIGYESTKVIIHDTYRKKVGGIPSLSFLIATRLAPHEEQDIDFTHEDTSFILLRVMDAASLPQDQEAQRIRVETAQRVSGENKHWDANDVMDIKTKNYLSFAGLECRIIGTFFFEEENNQPVMKFGSDISNYYPNRGLKVYKPVGEALGKIVNYCDPQTLKSHFENYHSNAKVKLGNVRYASTNRKYQQVDDVPVYIYPADLLSQKSALFGMTRTGKSNTTKIIAQSVYALRITQDTSNEPLRVGQIIFDPNGEYANDNVQDKDANNNPNSLKNIYKLNVGANKSDEVVTYGLTAHINDPDRKLMKLNFFEVENLNLGKSIIDSILLDDKTKYIQNFVQVAFEKPAANDRGAMTRYNRRVLAYHALLKQAGFEAPDNMKTVSIKGLFGQDLIKALNKDETDLSSDYKSAAKILENERVSLPQLSIVFKALDSFIRDTKSAYRDFNNSYIQSSSSGEQWADEDFKKIIGMWQYANGARVIGKAIEQHDISTTKDYSEEIYEHLRNGRLVIIDQSSGNPELNKSSAQRIMRQIFGENQKLFRDDETDIPNILVYIEEAHNLLPAGNDFDTSDIWVRTAKEGAKYRIGMVYATQEVSSIQKNILKNTSNWFISHLNNTDETKELCKYYDFIDFEPSIRRAQDKGFLRVKTLSNLFVIPVQVDKFEINT